MTAPIAMHPRPASLPYRSGVGIMLLNARNQVFVAKRIDMTSEAWQMPQGGVDNDENALTAARRELAEETSITHVTMLAESKDWLTYDLPEDLIPRIWSGCYRGQRQKWFAMRFTGAESEIDIATPEPEFMEWKWVAPRRLPDLIVPFKRPLYVALLDEFQEHLG